MKKTLEREPSVTDPSVSFKIISYTRCSCKSLSVRVRKSLLIYFTSGLSRIASQVMVSIPFIVFFCRIVVGDLVNIFVPFILCEVKYVFDISFFDMFQSDQTVEFVLYPELVYIDVNV